MADCLNNEQQINSNLSESNVDTLTSNLDGASSVTSEMGVESSISSTMSSTDTTTSNLGSEEPLNSELDLPTTYTYKGSETDNIVVEVDNKGFIISASVKQIKFNSVSDFPEVGSEHLIYIDATNKALYGWDANSGYYKLVADVKVPTKLSEFENDGDGINPFITKVVSDLQNYYTKSETYTQDEIKNLVSAIPKFSIKVVTSLPTTDISETTVYLVASGSESQNLYTEYIYVNDTWEKLGEQRIDLSNYPTIEEMNTAIANALASYYTKTETDALLGNKVDKVEGEGLSTIKDASVTNDVLTIEKQDGSTLQFEGGGIDEQELPFMPIGSIFASAIPQEDARVHLLDGSTISQTGVYETFANLIKALVSAGNPITCTQEQFDEDVNLTGNCGKFVINDTAGTIRLPKITTFIQGLSNITNIGSSLSAGIPNLTGTAYTVGAGSVGLYSGNSNGVFKAQTTVSGQLSNTTGGTTYKELTFDASRISSIYNDATTVQPNATQYPYYIVLASGYKSSQVVDIDNVVSDINNLANEVNNKASKPTNTQLWSGSSATSATIEDISNYDFIMIMGKTKRSGEYWTTAIYPIDRILTEFNNGYEFRLVAFGGEANGNYEFGIRLTNTTSLTTYYTNLSWMRVVGIKF